MEIVCFLKGKQRFEVQFAGDKGSPFPSKNRDTQVLLGTDLIQSFS